MAEGERDSTQDWLLPEGAAPPTLAQLEQKVDFAIAVARASEAAVVEIGAAALDAAEQAHRAAALAERASGAGATAAPAVPPTTGSWSSSGGQDAAMRHFLERAEQLSARLEAIAGV